MANIMKEIGRRVTLYDIIEQSEQTNKLLKDIKDEQEQMPQALCYLLRHASRVMFRMTGNIEVALAGYYGYTTASVDPDQIPKCVMLGVAGVLMYLADYALFDRMSPLPKPKED